MAAVALAVLDATELDAMAEDGDTGLPAWVERDTIAVAAFREYSVAQAHEATVHPRWEELKARADQALKDGDLDGAIEGFTSVLSIAEATHAVAALFDLLNSWPADSAGAQLAAAKEDIAPIVREYLPGPVLARGEPNRAVAICLTNRATAHLQAGRPEAAVADARAATLACPEYIKGHYCLGQAAHSLLCPPHLRGPHSSAVPSSPTRPASAAAEECSLQGGAWEAGGGPTDAVVPAIHPRSAALIRRFEDLSRPENPMAALGRVTGATHRHPLQPWLGFRLVMCGWLPPSTYYPVYEDPRASAWRDLARRAIGNELGSGSDDYRFLRVHMEVHDPVWTGSTTGPQPNDHPLADSDFLPVSLHVTPTRPRVLSGPCRVAPPPELPSSIDYRHLRLPMRLDDPALDAAATGRMVATALSAMFRADGGLPMVATLGLGGVRSRTCGIGRMAARFRRTPRPSAATSRRRACSRPYQATASSTRWSCCTRRATPSLTASSATAASSSAPRTTHARWTRDGSRRWGSTACLADGTSRGTASWSTCAIARPPRCATSATRTSCSGGTRLTRAGSGRVGPARTL